MLAALAIASVAWNDRVRALTLLFFLLPTYLVRFTFFGLPMTMLEGMLLALFIIFVIRDTALWTAWRPRAWEMLLIFLPLLASLFGLLVSPNIVAGLGIWKAYIIEPLLLYIVIRHVVKHTHDLRRIFWALILSATCISFIALIQYFTAWGIPEPWNGFTDRRATFWYGYPNAVGLFVAPILAFTAAFTLHAERFRKTHAVYLYPFLLIMAGGLFAARVEGALVAVAAALFVSLLFTRFRVMIIVLAVAGLAAVFSFETTRQIFLFQDVSGDVRLALWTGTRNLLTAQPFFGAGLAGFPSTYDLYRLNSHVELLLYPHNIFLNFWVELGIIGLLWLFLAFGHMITRSIQILRREQTRAYGIALLAVVTAIVVYGLVDVPYFKNDLAILFWFWLAVPVILLKKERT